MTLTEQLQRVVELAEKAASVRSDDFGHSVSAMQEWQSSELDRIADDTSALARAWLLVLPALDFWIDSPMSGNVLSEADRRLIVAVKAAKAELSKLGDA